MNENVLTVIRETEILGKKIQMYGSVENPYFIASDVANWLGERDGYTVARKVTKEEKGTQIVRTNGGNQNTTVLTEDGLYEACMLSRKPISKPLKKEIKKYLKSIRLTGAAIHDERKTVEYYFSSFSDDLKEKVFSELYHKNQELQQFYDDLINSEGLISINTAAKELSIGEYKLFEFLRKNKIFFYDKDMVNIPYERFRKEGKFVVKETPCHDGEIRSITYATKRGLEYVRKLLRDSGYYDTVKV